MRKNLFFTAICIASVYHAQQFINSNECIKMYSNTYITKTGAFYSAWLKNSCSEPRYVGISEYVVRFEMSDKDGKTKMFAKKKDIDFPAAFLSPGAVVYGNKRSKDYSSGTTFDDIRSETGLIGMVHPLAMGEINGFQSKHRLSEGQTLLIGQNNGINFYATLKTYDGFFDKDWGNFNKYRVEIQFENTKSTPDPNTYDAPFEISFCGIIFSGSASIRKLKAYERYTKTENFKFISNIADPVVFFRNSAGSSAQPPYEYTPEKTAALIDQNLTLDEWINHRDNAREEKSPEEKQITDYIFSKFSNTPYVNFQKAIAEKDNSKGIAYYQQAIELAKEKNTRYYLAHYNIAARYAQRGDEYWQNRNYAEAEKDYQEALRYHNLSAPAVSLTPNLTPEKYAQNTNTYTELAGRYAREQEKMANEQRANAIAFSGYMKQGDSTMQIENYFGAIGYYERAVKLNVDSEEANSKLNKAREQLALVKAKENERIIQNTAFESSMKEGDEKLEQEDTDGAAKAFQKAIETGFNIPLASEKLQLANELHQKRALYLLRFSIIRDQQNKAYTTVKIEDQHWYMQNCRSYKYSDGRNHFEYLEKPRKLQKATRPSYFKPDRSYSDTAIGSIYSYHCIKQELVCPEGWRIAKVEDWQKLIKNLQGEKMASNNASGEKYLIRNVEALEYKKQVTKAILSDCSGFGLQSPGFIVGTELNPADNRTYYFWSKTGNDDLAVVSFYKKTNVIEVQIDRQEEAYFHDKGYACKCVKE